MGEVVEINNGRDYKHLSVGNVPVYGTGGYMLSVNQALSDSKDAIGIGRKGTIDKPFILKAPFWTVDTLFYAIPKEMFDLEFVNSLFLNTNWKSKNEATGVPSLSKSTIYNSLVKIPEIKEQRFISGLLTNIEKLITLHQCEPKNKDRRDGNVE